mgnify:CR=1 FL=1
MTNNDWWAKKLGTPGQRSTTPPTSPPPGNVYRPPAPVQNPQVAYDPQQDQLVTRAQSAKMLDRCPGCGSGNYMAPMGTKLQRCYDCGYPLVQSGTGAGTPSGSASSGPTIAAKQVGQNDGFNPQIIVGRVD